MSSKVVENRLVIVNVGDVIEHDAGRRERLLESNWDRAEFRWPNPINEWREKHALAINVGITGRTFQYRNGDYWVRVRLEYVNDDGPSTYGSGWLKSNPWLLTRVDYD